ncbi:MAG: hypothetical protein KDA42_09765 [Planctomycetales bacterium]|nr:hypothetical protein [Planctomycetales bacterium]
MTAPDTELSKHLSAPALLANAGWLAVILLAALLVVAPIAGSAWGMMAVWSACLAAAVCLVAALVGLLVAERFRRAGNQVGFLLGGLVPRMVIPLAVCLVIHWLGGPLVDGKAVPMLLLFYLVALSVETYLTVSSQKSHVGSR